VTAQNVANRLIGYGVTQIGQRTYNAVVTPAGVFPCHPDDQSFQLFVNLRSSGILAVLGAIELLRDQLPVPSQDRVGFGDTSDFPQSLPSYSLSDFGPE
jgi:hypothetical protein